MKCALYIKKLAPLLSYHIFTLTEIKESSFISVTVTVTKVFILRFLLKDWKCITESFTYIQRSPG